MKEKKNNKQNITTRSAQKKNKQSNKRKNQPEMNEKCLYTDN